MARLKRICMRVLFPPEWLAVLIALPSFALVIDVLASGQSGTPTAYLSYGLSAYALVLTVVRIPGVVRAFRSGFERHPLVHRTLHSQQGERLRQDALYRAEMGLYAGLGVNLIYVAIKAVFGVIFHSPWFGALAGYYLLLALMRFALLHHVHRQPAGRDLLAEWRRYRLCGAVLLVMNQALAVVVYLMVKKNNGFEYPGYLIYVMAAYTFYTLALAVVNMVKFRKRGSPVLSAAKAVSLVAALVSLLALETAMLSQFGSEQGEGFRLLMISCTGIAVCVIVLAMAIYMIIRSTGRIRALRAMDQ